VNREGFVPWPAELSERYSAAGYWRGLPLGYWMWRWAEQHADRVAISDGDLQFSYGELAQRADALAENLSALGLRDGDNILVQLPNCWQFAVLLFACQRIGVAPVLALLPHRGHELSYLADLAEVAAIVVPSHWHDFDHQELAAGIAATARRHCQVLVLGDGVRPPHVALEPLVEVTGDTAARRARLDAGAPDAGDIALFVLSGGTTGTPKIIARTHNDYEYNARRSAEVSGFDADTVFGVALPLAHNFPLGSPGVLGTLIHGGRAVMLRSPRPEAAFPVIERERVTNVSLVPAIAVRWAEAAATSAHDLSSLRVVQVGGSVLAPSVAARIGPALDCELQQVYGMAEGLLNYTRFDDPPEVVLSTQGRPICTDDELRIVDKNGDDVPEGQPGELLTRGPYTTRGYFNAPEHNARAFTPEGWYRTGDLVRRHESGNLVVEDRVKDLINRGGEKISVSEVEELLTALPQVRRAAVVPVPDDVLGERVGACVVLNAGCSLSVEELRASLTEWGVAKFKLPERLKVLTELPLTPVGKVDRTALKQAVLHAEVGASW
jgi:2,3-dihydroxybenzoate-AMP ligase